jgi:hypothetical protein
MAEAEPSKCLSRDQYLAKAGECRELARSSAKAEHRTMLEEMAQAWERIAASWPPAAT